MAEKWTLKDRFQLLNNLFGHAAFEDHIMKAHLLRKYLAVKQSILADPDDDGADEMIILSDVLWFQDARPNVVEVMSGAHVWIMDQGDSYRAWKQLRSKDDRPSSHPSDDTQYSVDGPFCHSILFSKFGNHTWVQLENNPFSRFPLFLLSHGMDFLAYKISGNNQGPYGSSQFTDKNPLRVAR